MGNSLKKNLPWCGWSQTDVGIGPPAERAAENEEVAPFFDRLGWSAGSAGQIRPLGGSAVGLVACLRGRPP